MHRDEHWDEPSTPKPAAGGVLMFALCFVLLLAGFFVMGFGFDEGLGPVFAGGLALATLAFFIPLARSR